MKGEVGWLISARTLGLRVRKVSFFFLLIHCKYVLGIVLQRARVRKRETKENEKDSKTVGQKMTKFSINKNIEFCLPKRQINKLI